MTKNDGCLVRPRQKKAGAVVYLVEELGDARMRCDQLMRYIAEAMRLVDASQHREHFFEVAGHLIQAVPTTAFKLQKALQAVALAANRIDYEELKTDLRPEKVEQLESVLEDVRIRQVQHRSEPPMTTNKDFAQKLRQIAATTREYQLPQHEVVKLIVALEQGQKTAEPKVPMADYLDRFAAAVENDGAFDRQRLAACLRRMVGDVHVTGHIAAVSQYADNPIFTQAGSREDVMEGFKKENPALTKAQLEEIADHWEKNKDVVKDKTANRTAADSVVHAAILKSWEGGQKDANQILAKNEPALNEMRADYAIGQMQVNAAALKRDAEVAESWSDEINVRHCEKLFRDMAGNLSAATYWMGYVRAMAGAPGVAGNFEVKTSSDLLRWRTGAADPQRVLDQAVKDLESALKAGNRAFHVLGDLLPDDAYSDLDKALKLLAKCRDRISTGKKTASVSAPVADIRKALVKCADQLYGVRSPMREVWQMLSDLYNDATGISSTGWYYDRKVGEVKDTMHALDRQIGEVAHEMENLAREMTKPRTASDALSWKAGAEERFAEIPLPRLERAVDSVEEQVRTIRHGLDLYKKDPQKHLPQIENVEYAAIQLGSASKLILRAIGSKKTASDEDKQSKFEEGKPADPTKDMSPEDAKEWKANTEEHKDKFKKEAADAKKALLELYKWATGQDRSGNPYTKPAVRNAIKALGNKEGYDLPEKRPSGKVPGALYDLAKWATGGNRSGNPHTVDEVKAANRALGGDGFDLPEDLKTASDPWKVEAAEPITTKLRDGTEVLAKLYHGEPTAMTFANRTQAYKAAERLGPGWVVIQRGRPWFVARDDSSAMKRVLGDELREMEQLLKARGYDPGEAHRLQDEGMGPIELEHILKTTEPGSVGSLEYTHNIQKKLASDPWGVEAAQDFHKGDKVEVLRGKQKGLEGTVTSVGSGPGGDQVSVALDHPVQRMMGPAIINPKDLRKKTASDPWKA